MIRNSKYEASDVVPGPGSNVRHPLAVFPSLHRVPAGPVPLLHQYYQSATTPCSHPAALRFLRLAVPQRSLVVFAPRRTSAPPRPGVGDPVSPAGSPLKSEQGSPKFLRNLNCPFANVPIRRRQDCLHQTISVQQRGPWFLKCKGSHERSFDAQ